jgi:hypothetical protein
MGLLDRFKLPSYVAMTPASDYPANRMARAGIVSPWAEGQLQEFVWNDIFGTDTVPVTRIEAMSLPSVVVARGLLLGALAGRPLRALRGQELLDPQPTWLYRTDTDLPPWHRMAHTLDDIIFYGSSLWAVERGSEGQITDAVRVPWDRWEVDPTGDILIDDIYPDRKSVIYFPGPFEGLLNVAGRSIRAAVDLEGSWAGRARTPSPAIVLEEKEDNGMTQAEASAYVKAVAAARRDPDGTVMYIPYSLNARFEGNTSTDLMIEARNAVKLDIANFLNVPTAMLDAALPKASLNYETQDGRQEAFIERLPYWTEPIEARLSMDDVCPRGQRIRFDVSPNSNRPGGQTGPYTED